MLILETDDPCIFEVVFDSKKEELFYREKVKQWSGKKRFSRKQWEAWVNHVLMEEIKKQNL